MATLGTTLPKSVTINELTTVASVWAGAQFLKGRALIGAVHLLLTLDETFDIGADTRSPVDDNDYQIPFRFTGKIDKLT
jgi:hypothetical protein